MYEYQALRCWTLQYPRSPQAFFAPDPGVKWRFVASIGGYLALGSSFSSVAVLLCLRPRRFLDRLQPKPRNATPAREIVTRIGHPAGIPSFGGRIPSPSTDDDTAGAVLLPSRSAP